MAFARVDLKNFSLRSEDEDEEPVLRGKGKRGGARH
jgi:hypothetical protein